MLDIKNLTVQMNRDLKMLVKGISFSLNPGDKAAIIGEEGNGKSTLLKLIYNPALVDGYCAYTGEIIPNGAVLGYLAQEIAEEDRVLPLHEYFEKYVPEGERNPKTFAKTMAQLGLDIGLPYETRTIDTLSGGEKVKIQLARILLEAPDILLLDEPSNDLDIETVEWLERFISTSKLPILFVSHDETLLENTANMIIHLEQLRKKAIPRHTVERTDYRSYIESRSGKLAHQEQVARKERAEYEAQIDRWRQIYNKVDREQENISRGDPHGGRLLKKKMKAIKSAEKRFDREKEEMTEIPDTEDAILVSFGEGISLPAAKRVLDLQMDRITTGGPEDRTLARGVRLTVVGPEHIGIIGSNGVGKTTFLRILAEELLPRKDIKAAYMPQNYLDLLPSDLTPAEYLSGGGGKDALTRARTYLGSMKYTHEEMTGKIAALSGGQKAKLLFLRMILDGCNVLLLDEPTRNFSPLSNPVIRKTLVEFKGAIISISHDRKFLGEVCEKVYRLTPEGLELISTSPQGLV